MRGLASRFDQLALLGKPLDYEDKIEYIIDGLPEDYKSVVEQVEGRDTTPSIVEIHEKLVNKEAKLLSMNTTSLNTAPVSSNVATSRPRQYNNNKQQYRSNNSNWNNNNKPPQHYNNS